MAALPYYKRYPRDFIEGTIGLGLEVKGAYAILLDLIYMHSGQCPDDARYVSTHLGCSLRKWTSIRQELISKNKIQIFGEFISNFRATFELESSAKYQRNQAENASGSRKNNDLQKPSLNHTDTDTDTDTDIREDKKNPPSPPCRSDDVDEAFEAWNALASKANLSKAQKLTAPRRKAIEARLKDCGGMAGWMAAIENVRDSPFLCGDNDRGWKADLDFILQPKSFVRLMEGSYARTKSSGRSKQSATTAGLASLARAFGVSGGDWEPEPPAPDAGRIIDFATASGSFVRNAETMFTSADDGGARPLMGGESPGGRRFR